MAEKRKGLLGVPGKVMACGVSASLVCCAAIAGPVSSAFANDDENPSQTQTREKTYHWNPRVALTPNEYDIFQLSDKHLEATGYDILSEVRHEMGEEFGEEIGERLPENWCERIHEAAYYTLDQAYDEAGEAENAAREEAEAKFWQLEELAEFYWSNYVYPSVDPNDSDPAAGTWDEVYAAIEAYADYFYKECKRMGILDQIFIGEADKFTGEDIAEMMQQSEDNEIWHAVGNLDLTDLEADKVYRVAESEDDSVTNSIKHIVTDDSEGIDGALRIRDLFAPTTSEEPWVGINNGKGSTQLTLKTQSGEYGGTSEQQYIDKDGNPTDEPTDDEGNPNEENPLYNPDKDEDSLGDNLAFTVPSSINFVVKSTGEFIAPSNAYIENHSVAPLHASSLKVIEEEGWNIASMDDVESVSKGQHEELQDQNLPNKTNIVGIEMAARPTAIATETIYDSYLDLSYYLDEKQLVSNPQYWSMKAYDKIIASGNDTKGLTFGGQVVNVAANISERTKFAEIHWYMSSGSSENWVGISPTVSGVSFALPDNEQNYSTYLYDHGIDYDDVMLNDETYLIALESEPSRYLAFVASDVANTGDKLALHLSDGSVVKVLCVGTLSPATGDGDIQLKNDAGNQYICDSAGKCGKIQLLGENLAADGSDDVAVAHGIEDFTRMGHPGAVLFAVEKQGAIS